MHSWYCYSIEEKYLAAPSWAVGNLSYPQPFKHSDNYDRHTTDKNENITLKVTTKALSGSTFLGNAES